MNFEVGKNIREKSEEKLNKYLKHLGFKFENGSNSKKNVYVISCIISKWMSLKKSIHNLAVSSNYHDYGMYMI